MRSPLSPTPVPRFGPTRGRRQQWRSRPVPRAVGPAAVRCSVATPWKERSRGARKHCESTRQPARRRPARGIPWQGQAPDPSRPDGLRERLARHRRDLRSAGGCGPVRSAAIRARAGDRGATPRMPAGLPSPPRCRSRATAVSRHDGPGSVRGCSPRRARAVSAPSPVSTALPGRIARAPASRKLPRSRRSPSRTDQVHPRQWRRRLHPGV